MGPLSLALAIRVWTKAGDPITTAQAVEGEKCQLRPAACA